MPAPKLLTIFALSSLLGIACEVAETDARNTGTDGDSDSDTDTDTDGDTDGDSDGDSDTDSDGDGGVNDSGVIEMDCSACPGVGSSLENMLCAFDICDDTVVSQNEIVNYATFTSCSLEDTYEAVNKFGAATNELDPMLNDSYALLASGIATGTSHSTNCDSYSSTLTDPFVGDDVTIYDVVEWKVVLTAPDEAEAIRFKYVFFSEEYDDYILASVNDKFYTVLEAASTNGGAPTVINYTDCRDPAYVDFTTADGCDLDSGNCCYIAINSALSECCWYNGCPGSVPADNTDISGTGYECASSSSTDGSSTGSSSGWLQTSWPITGGETFGLTFHIHDTMDGIFDSQVILDSFEFLGTAEQGTVIVID